MEIKSHKLCISLLLVCIQQEDTRTLFMKGLCLETSCTGQMLGHLNVGSVRGLF